MTKLLTYFCQNNSNCGCYSDSVQEHAQLANNGNSPGNFPGKILRNENAVIVHPTCAIWAHLAHLIDQSDCKMTTSHKINIYYCMTSSHLAVLLVLGFCIVPRCARANTASLELNISPYCPTLRNAVIDLLFDLHLVNRLTQCRIS